MKIVKILTMGVLSAVAWISNWFLLKQSIYNAEPLTFLGWPSLATILGITLLTFFFLINKNRLVSIILDVIILVGYLVIMPKEFYVIMGGAVFFIFLVLFEQRLKEDEKSRLDFSMRRVTGGGITLTIYALLLLIALNVYYNTQADFESNPEAYFSKLEQAAIRGAERTVPQVTQNFDDQLTEEQQRMLGEMIAKEAVDEVRQSANKYQQFFPLVFTVIVMALLSTFAFLVRWATVLVSWLIFKLLLLIGFFKLENEMVEVKKLSI